MSADLRTKLNKLVVVEGPSRIAMTELTNPAGYTITAARLHSHAQYGISVILEVLVDNIVRMVFLPKRSPNGNFNSFIDQLDQCLTHVSGLNPRNLILCGDFNIHLECPSTEESIFVNLLRSYGLYVASRQPTRGTACLDSVASNFDSWKVKAEVVPSLVADHDGAVILSVNCSEVSLNSNPSWLKDYSIIKRPICMENLPLFRYELSNVDWSTLYTLTEPKLAFELFSSIFFDEFDHVFPAKLYNPKSKVCSVGSGSRHNKSANCWYTPELRRMRNYMAFVHDLYKGSSDMCRKGQLYSLYLEIKRNYRVRVNVAKKSFNAESILSAPNPCKAAWDIINKERAPGPGPKIQASPDELNEYFTSVAGNIISDLPVLQTDPLDSVPDYSSVHSFTCWNRVSVREISQMIKNFKDSKSQDVYGLSTHVLRAVADLVAVPLTHLVNLCLAHGFFPDSLKKARTVPIFKKGNPTLMENFRPISILPIFSKVMETVMKRQLLSYFENNGLLVDSQHGFRSGRSTTSALLSLVDTISQAFEENESVHLSLCDLSKAFDVVSHDILLAKLRKYGIGGAVFCSLADYLGNRKQIVTIMGASSAIGSLPHGVPQGSVLGPLLFTIMINDLATTSHALLFADDTTLVTKGKNIDPLLEEADNTLRLAKDWFIANKLKINEEKTQILLCSLKIGLEENSVKLLGFWMDSKLSWHHHIEKVCVKLSRVLHLLRKLRTTITRPYLLAVYHALFHSHLTYGLVLWGHSPWTQELLLLQKKALRIITSSGYKAHCRPIFLELGVLTVYSQYVLNVLILLKVNIHHFVVRDNIHSHHTRQACDIDLPRCRLARSLKSYPRSAIRFFNSLPVHIRDLDLDDFKTALRDRLVNRPLYSLEELGNEPLFGHCHSVNSV
ncbi:uncharacterized protein LOC128985133 [Macrosteles quadrilineatus]|uniref:uncharacterized protein LOC128985133 n=1 Tax=Macrosteles quadrilineatus TaxID=74068 RepID=UPI0023E1E588|nr:uncharacterized protein LOC128985133 [Macrosteles quadrilineatus]